MYICDMVNNNIFASAGSQGQLRYVISRSGLKKAPET